MLTHKFYNFSSYHGVVMLLSTHLLFRDSQQKQMDDLLVWFESSYGGWKQTK